MSNWIYKFSLSTYNNVPIIMRVFCIFLILASFHIILCAIIHKEKDEIRIGAFGLLFGFIDLIITFYLPYFAAFATIVLLFFIYSESGRRDDFT